MKKNLTKQAKPMTTNNATAPDRTAARFFEADAPTAPSKQRTTFWEALQWLGLILLTSILLAI